MFPTIALWLSAVIFFGFAAAFFLRPTQLARSVMIEAEHPTAKIEVRAMYGGLQTAVAAFLGYCAYADELALGLLASAFCYAGLGGGRLLGLLMSSLRPTIMWVLVGLEVVGTAVSLLAWRAI